MKDKTIRKDSSARIRLTITEGQARAITEALDLYARLGIGQFEYVAEQMRYATIPRYRPLHAKGKEPAMRRIVSPHVIEEVEQHLDAIKILLGYPLNGSHSIGHPDNHISVTRSYEANKVLKKALADAHNPGGGLIDHDGLTVRYTDDPAPIAEWVELNPGEEK